MYCLVFSGLQVRQLIGWHRPLPLEEERARLLREVGTVLQAKFNGSAADMIQSAQGSAVTLVDILSANFRGECATELTRRHCDFALPLSWPLRPCAMTLQDSRRSMKQQW